LVEDVDKAVQVRQLTVGLRTLRALVEPVDPDAPQSELIGRRDVVEEAGCDMDVAGAIRAGPAGKNFSQWVGLVRTRSRRRRPSRRRGRRSAPGGGDVARSVFERIASR
jgi:hypothetical protein